MAYDDRAPEGAPKNANPPGCLLQIVASILAQVIVVAGTTSISTSSDAARSEPAEVYLCSTEAAVNVSTGAPVPLGGTERRFEFALFQPASPWAYWDEVLPAPHNGYARHEIDVSTGRYRSSTFLTDHAAGEEYLIETTGRCRSAGQE